MRRIVVFFFPFLFSVKKIIEHVSSLVFLSITSLLPMTQLLVSNGFHQLLSLNRTNNDTFTMHTQVFLFDGFDRYCCSYNVT